MRNTFATRTRLFAGAGVAALSLAAFASPAYAQDVEAEADVSTTTDVNEGDASAEAAPTIVVTGSRIRRPELESTVPVTNFSGDQIYKQSGHNLGEALNDLPALRSTFAQSNPGPGIGVAGLNLLDLRGLGVQRTLVLVNGRRHVPSDLQVTASAVDINTIPTDLVERIDIVTGGNSAVYGSDAIAGVVNFILKDDFEGITIRGGAGIPEYGAGANYFLSGVAGTNFADGRGNIAASVEYTRQNRIFASDVPWRRTRSGFVTVDADPEGSDGLPDSVFMHDLRGATISRYGLIPFPQTRGNATCGMSIPNGAGSTSPYNCNYIFTPAGDLVPVVADAQIGTSPYSTYIGGNADTGREGRQVSVYPFSERYVANLMGHYEFSDAFEVFFEGKYARARSVGSNSGPAFNQGQGFTFLDPRSQYRLDNPFLSSSARGIIADAILDSGLNNGLLSGGALSDEDRAAIADGSYRFALAKSFEDLGIRDEDALRETYRIVVGARGDISDNWSYEVSANYGRTEERIDVLGNVNVQRLMLAMDAGIDPATGQIACRAQFDPSAAFVSPDVNSEGGAGNLASDIAACVPYNPFGAPNNAAARNYIVSNSGNQGWLEQVDVTAFVAGDTSGWFELPGGPIGIAVGAEYRREDAFFEADDVINSGMTFMNALQTFDPDPFEVKEAFGELNIPLLADRPFFEELTLSGAARVSDYQGATGTVWAYNFGGRWSPISDISFRANYGRAIRAPNYTETSSPLGQNFAPGFGDPCSANRIGSGSETRRANCEADLGALLGNDDFQDKVGGVYSLEILSGSNPNLTEETSNSLTIGTVIQPRFVPGLAVTIDYFNIEVNDVIASPSAQAIVNSCYDLPSLDNQFCALFERYEGTGTGPNGEVPGEILVQSLQQTPLNFAKRVRRGIDVDVSYRQEIGTNTFINSRLYYTHALKSSNYEDPSRPDYENRLLSELGQPKDEFVFDVDLTFDDFTLGYGLHYVGPMLTSSYEDFFSLQGRPAQNPDVRNIREYPEALYHDVRVAWQLGGDGNNQPFEFYAGVDNLFNKKPPLDLDGLTSGSAIYDALGRSYYAGFRAQF